MYDLPLITKDELEVLPHDVLVETVLKLQQIGLMQDNQISKQKILIDLCNQAIALYEEALDLMKTNSERENDD